MSDVPHAIRVAGTALFLVLGSCSDPEVPVERVKSVSWRALAEAPSPRTEVFAAAVGPRIFVGAGFVPGGGSTSVVEVYDTETDTWARGPRLPVAVNHPMSAAADGILHVSGGFFEGATSDRAFALRDGRWEELRPMPEPRAAAGAAAVDGKIYVVGGIGPDGHAETTLVFDPASGQWSAAPGIPTPRDHLGVASDGKRIFAVGGRFGDLASNQSIVEAFDPATGEWEELPDLPTARGGLGAAFTANGYLVAAGGEENRGTFQEVEVFDGTTWLALPGLPTPRHGLGVVAVGTVVYVIAGGPEPGLAFSGANEAVDLAPLG